MSQNDYVIANQTTPLFRADLNLALQALASNSSGSSAPSTTYANMLWYDTTNNILKMRSEADDAWISLGTLDQSLNTFTPAGLTATSADPDFTVDPTLLANRATIATAIAAGGAAGYAAITASTTFLKSSLGSFPDDHMVRIEAWGGGGGGSANSLGGGGGGAGYSRLDIRWANIPSSLSITIGAGGAVGANGGITTVGSLLTAYNGGGAASGTGISGAGGGAISGADLAVVGSLGGGASGITTSTPSSIGRDATGFYGGAGGGYGGGGSAYNGGGGGCNVGTPGTPINGGAGGATGVAGSAPGGGGGRNAVGSRGEVRIWA
jgi:hypothetical protein